MSMDFMTTARDWDRMDKVPKANNDIVEGTKYFDIHEFYFKENEGYSQVGDLAGYHTLPGGIEAWRELLVQWENDLAPTLMGWEGRQDMEVLSDASRANGYNDVASLVRHIIRSARVRSSKYQKYSPGENCHYVDWQELRDDRNQYKKMEFDTLPEIGEPPTVKELSASRLRVQSLAYSRAIDANLNHALGVENYQFYVKGARLVVWVETELRGEELAWRWLGSIYSWKNCRMNPLDACDAQTQTNVVRLVTSLARDWTQLLRELSKKPAEGPGGDKPLDLRP